MVSRYPGSQGPRLPVLLLGLWVCLGRHGQQCPSVGTWGSREGVDNHSLGWAGPAVWKRPCEQTEYKQAAPWEVRVSPWLPHPLPPLVFLPSLPRRPDSSCQLLSTKCLQPHPLGKDFLDYLPNSSSFISLFLIRPGAHPLNKVGLGTLLTQIFRKDRHSPWDCLEERGGGVRLQNPVAESQKLPPPRLPRRLSPKSDGTQDERKRLARQPLGGVLKAVVSCHTASIQENIAHQPSLGPAFQRGSILWMKQTSKRNSQKGQQQQGSGGQPIDYRGPLGSERSQGPGTGTGPRERGLSRIRWCVRASVRLDRIQEALFPGGA